MEQEGIYYYFQQDNGKHTLILADSYCGHARIPGFETIPYYPPNKTTVRDKHHISRWGIAKKVQPGRLVLDDFDFEMPKANIQTNATIARDHAQSDSERYDYPGNYRQHDHGETYARTRIEALHSQYETLEAESDVRVLQSGALFKLDHYSRQDQDREYLIVSVTHKIKSDAYRSSDQQRGPTYTNSFTAIESETPYRPPGKDPQTQG